MKQLVLVTVLSIGLAVSAAPAFGQAPTAGSSLGNVTLPRAVLADGQRLASGTYQIRLSGESPAPAVGQSPEGAQYVEFLREGQVVGREIATVVPAGDVGQIAEGPRPGAGRSRVELLRGADYLRVWINRGGVNFLIHLPPAPA
jgi:hypothetical protein